MRSSKGKLSTRLLYLGITWMVLLIAGILVQVNEDWQARVDAGRARALYEMVHDALPNRPTDTPGVSAWLHWELRKYLRREGGLDAEFAAWQDYRSIPRMFQPPAELLVAGGRSPVPVDPSALTMTEPAQAELDKLRFRTQFFVDHGPHRFVVTRRRAIADHIGERDNPSNRFLYQALGRLEAVQQQLATQTDLNIARIYALCEDSMLVTLPVDRGGLDHQLLLEREAEELRKMPKLPNFVSNEFFFVFDNPETDWNKPFFSGLYLDLGGHGLIATLSVPFATGPGELAGVLAVDVAFELDWSAFASGIAAPLIVEVVTLDGEPRADGWRPWSALAASGKLKDAALTRVVKRLAQGEHEARHFHNPSPIYHDVVADEGALVAFGSGPDTWLVILFPEAHTRFPWLSILLLSALLVVVLAGFEWNRARAEAAQKEAEGAFLEKQNLLESMGVPLMVVDPNSEAVVYSNKAAADLGVRQGGRFTEIVADDEAARAHYQRMQIAAPEERRAYGLPLKVGEETRYAVIRSVAVRAPIPMIGADERHRLGIVFLIEPEEDLKLLTGPLTSQVRREEQRKLSGLLSHGVDTLARVLNRRLERGEGTAFDAWLSGYIQRRIRVVAWLLDQWEADTPPEKRVVIGPEHVRKTVARLAEVWEEARTDGALRAQLHWNNGILAGDLGSEPLIHTRLRWADGFCFGLPVHGGLGLFLSEALVNAVRHGKPGNRPIFEVNLDRLRHELHFSITNEVRRDMPDNRLGKKYGGRSIMEQLARLFDWRELVFEHSGTQFKVSWTVPVAEQRRAEEGD